MEHPFYKKIGYLFIFLILLGWSLVLFYNAIPLEFKSYIIEKNKFLLINAEETINFLSKDPDKSMFIFICSFYFGVVFTFSYLFVIIFRGDWYAFDVKIPIYKAIPFFIFSYIFFSLFYICCTIFPGYIPRVDRLFWTGGLISNVAIVFFMVCQGINNMMIFNCVYLIRKLIKGGSL